LFLKRLAHAGTVFFVALSSLFVCVSSFAQGSSVAGMTTFVFDGNRIYAALGFVRSDGSIHRALAFVDMGSPSMAESARGLAPRAAHRSGRKPLDLSGSCHPLKAAAFHRDRRVPPVTPLTR
jgi:hypothetical protein